VSAGRCGPRRGGSETADLVLNVGIFLPLLRGFGLTDGGKKALGLGRSTGVIGALRAPVGKGRTVAHGGIPRLQHHQPFNRLIAKIGGQWPAGWLLIR
jgi:hypothetical protein